MIAHLRGKVILKQSTNIILDVAGVGYELSVAISLLEGISEGDEISLFVHHSLRDDGNYLYGFNNLLQRQLFRELISVAGIGAKTALLLLSAFSCDELLRVISEGNTKLLLGVPGIGAKTAARLIVELRDRLAKITSAMSRNDSAEADDANQALVALGYKQAEAARLVAQVLRQYQAQQLTSDAILKLALQHKFHDN